MTRPTPAGAPSPAPALETLHVPLLHYLWTSNLVFLALMFGTDFVRSEPGTLRLAGKQTESFTNWDAQWYRDVSVKGYWYEPGKSSNVAFFPAYPLACRLVARATGLKMDYAQLATSNAFLLLAFLALHVYTAVRFPGAGPAVRNSVLVAFGLLPTTFFFRMGYSEALFVLVIIATLYAMDRGYPLWLIAALVGLATATRSVGVALLPAFVLHVRDRSTGAWVFTRRLVTLLPVACWGLLAFTGFQYVEFGDPMAFARVQDTFKLRPTPPTAEKWLGLVTLEPVRSMFNPRYGGYWWTLSPSHYLLFTVHAVDPFIFLGAIALSVYGLATRLLNRLEFVASMSLILVPYVLIGYESFMRSQGRYSSAAVPVYLVLGHLLSRAPAPVATGLTCFSSVLMVLFTCIFGGGHSAL